MDLWLLVHVAAFEPGEELLKSVWVLPDIFVLCFLHIFSYFNFLLYFILFYSQFSLFILILAFSSLLSLFLSFIIYLSGEVNSCRKFSVRLTWLCLDGFEGRRVAAKTRILSWFFLMTPSLLFTSLGSFLVFHLHMANGTCI